MNPFSGRAKLFLLAIALFAPLASAAPGDIDPSFGSNGNARLDFTYTQSVDVRAATPLGDGAFVVGTIPRVPADVPGARQLVVGRLGANGEPDPLFGNRGWLASFEPLYDCDPVSVHPDPSGEPLVLCVAEGRLELHAPTLGGFAQTELGSTYPEGFDVRSVAVQPDGSIVVAGSFNQAGQRLVFVHRYLDRWLTPDPWFGYGGQATILLPSANIEARAVAVGPNGVILVAGSASTAWAGTDMMVARLTSGGALDGTFAKGGIATADHIGEDDIANAIALDPLGRAVVGGVANVGGQGRFFLWRLTPEGFDDFQFGQFGKVSMDVPVASYGTYESRVATVNVNADGTVLAGGTVRHLATGDVDFGFARLTSDGWLDSSFCNGAGECGRFAAPTGGEADVLLGIVAPFSPAFAAVGRQGAVTGTHLVVTRHLSSGPLDTAFGVNGRASHQVGIVPYLDTTDVALQFDGRIVAAGLVGSDGMVVRFNADGTVDTAFGAGGKVPLPGIDFEPLLAMQADGKIVIAGGSFPSRAQRLLADGSPDPAWNSGAAANFVAANTVRAIAVQPDGKVVASHLRWNHVVVSRLNADGSPDASFGANGEVDVALSPEAYEQDSTALHVLPDGKIVIAGGTRLYPVVGGVVRYVITAIRLLPSGALDATWGSGGIAHADIGDFAYAHDMAVDGAGRVIAAGGCRYPAVKPCFARFTPGGILDTSFGVGGFVEMSMATNNRVVAMRLDSAGRMLAALANGNLVRLLPDGRLDDSFGAGGFANAVFGFWPTFVVQPDDSLVVTSEDAVAWSLWRVEGGSRDTTPPDTALAFQPATNPANSGAFSATLSSEPGATFECSLDGAAFAACTSPVTRSVADGTHTFQVRARDAAGNVDPTPASWTWSVDSAAPETSITAGPSGAVASTSATFSFSASESPATFQCSLDGAAFADCGGASYSGLAQGAHTFAVRAIDAAGNVDPTPAVRTWTVDTVAPETTITGGPSGNNNPRTATFTFSSNESGATFECSLDAAAFVPCSSGVTYTNLSRGEHQFRVRARDEAGNLDATPAARTWRVK